MAAKAVKGSIKQFPKKKEKKCWRKPVQRARWLHRMRSQERERVWKYISLIAFTIPCFGREREREKEGKKIAEGNKSRVREKPAAIDRSNMGQRA